MVKNDHHFGVAIDHDVWIVGCHDDLPLTLVLADLLNDQVVDQVVVQIIFGLVEDNRLCAVREYEGEDCCRFLSRRALFNRYKVASAPTPPIFNAKLVFGPPELQSVNLLRPETPNVLDESLCPTLQGRSTRSG